MASSENRKLLAILYADVKGYSRMMEADASSTVKSLIRTRELFGHHVSLFNGRIVNAPGDSILVEFQSVVDAVHCGMTIQKELHSQNQELPDPEQMEYRIGINLGDVIHKNDELFGDGVNIAARVEALTPVGGVCITRPVYDQVKTVLSQFEYRYTGKHTVKNIKGPVWVYEVLGPTDQPVNSSGAPRLSSDAVQGAAGVTVAVLPFENLSGQEKHDYFTRGFVEDLMTDIAHFKSLQVISSYTARKICARGKDELRVSNELGIDYLLRGSLTRRKEDIRITAQLIDTEQGRLLWAEKYNSPIEEIFDIQDAIVEQVAGSISIQIDRELLAKARRKPATSLAAYDFWLQGMELLRNGSTETDQRARKLFDKALLIDPYFSRAYTGISLSHFNDWSCQVTDQWDKIGTNAYNYAVKAVELDSTDHVAQLVIGRILMFKRKFDLAEEHINKSISLNPNDADNLTKQASCKAFLGKPEEGEKLFLKALKLNPYRNLWYFTHGSLTYFIQKNFKKAIETALKGPLTEEWIDLPAFIAASYAHLGEPENAKKYLKIFIMAFQDKMTRGRAPEPDEIIEWCKRANPFRYNTHADIYINGLVKAGLKEKRSRTAGLPHGASDYIFKQEDGLWVIGFEDKTIRIQGVKGFFDIARLLARPGGEIHSSELMGRPGSFTEDAPVVDERAKKEYEKRIRDLKTTIDISDRNNDIGRSETLRAELDQLVDHLSNAFGVFNHSRKLNSDSERSRTAVTWRIRSAIKKIKSVHPALSRHLENCISTGTFCCYQPEKDIFWQL